MDITFETTVVMLRTSDIREGRLIKVDGAVVAVLTRLIPGEDADDIWYLEAGFGAWESVNNPSFSSLDVAAEWVTERQARLI